MLLLAIPLAPLLAAFVAFALRNSAPRVCQWLGLSSLAASLVSAVLLFTQGSARLSLPWINLPVGSMQSAAAGEANAGMSVPLAFAAGNFQLLFAVTTALVGLAVVLFAMRERRDDPRAGQFFATITLFAGAMLLFLTADTLFLVYFAWELMGICSYLLIAHPGTEAARRAARRAFWTTRTTDFGLLFAVIILLSVFGVTTISGIDPAQVYENALKSGFDTRPLVAWMGAAAMLVLAAVIGKAAQFPLTFWLPGAMVAPSPVSALLHAATMVAAGPYLLLKLHGLMFVRVDAMVEGFQPAMLAATLLGAITLVLGSLMALCAREPKKILAFSTISHLGLVVLAAGVLAPGAGYFHLLAHAYLKAALFLAVGYVVYTAVAGPAHGSAGLAELRGSVRHPLARWTLVLGGLGLSGFALTGGFFGKEQVLTALVTQAQTEFSLGTVVGAQFPLAAAGWKVAAVLAFISVPLTAAYITRLVAALIWGKPQGNFKIEETREESTPEPAAAGWGVGLGAALLLAVIGCIGLPAALAWYKGLFASASFGMAWEPGIQLGWPMMLGIVLTLIGIFAAWYYTIANSAASAKLMEGDSTLSGFVRFFGEGMRLEEFWAAVVGSFGLFAAVVADIIDRGVIDWLAERGGSLGRALSAVANWIDIHVIDGLRYLACEFWWMLKRVHSRTMQTGSIQHYMMIVILAALLLCFVVMRPMGSRLVSVVENILGRGLL